MVLLDPFLLQGKDPTHVETSSVTRISRDLTEISQSASESRYCLVRHPLPVREIGGWGKECPGSPSRVISVLVATNTPDVSCQVEVPAELREASIVSPLLPSWCPGDPVSGTVEEHKQLAHVLLYLSYTMLHDQSRYLGIPWCTVVTRVALSTSCPILGHNVPDNLNMEIVLYRHALSDYCIPLPCVQKSLVQSILPVSDAQT